MKYEISIEAVPIAIRLPVKDHKMITKLVEMGYYMNISDFIRDAVRDKLGDLMEQKIVKIREIDKTEAKKEIINYLDRKTNAWTYEIADDLGLDLRLVHEAIEELEREGLVGGVSGSSKK